LAAFAGEVGEFAESPVADQAAQPVWADGRTGMVDGGSVRE
jgi:hypothetical protein